MPIFPREKGDVPPNFYMICQVYLVLSCQLPSEAETTIHSSGYLLNCNGQSYKNLLAKSSVAKSKAGAKQRFYKPLAQAGQHS